MNERGFVTIFGLCLILISTLIVKEIQTIGLNLAYEIEDFRAESELQNLADSGIYEAAELVQKNEKILPKKIAYKSNNRKEYQIKLVSSSKFSERYGTFMLEVYGERCNDYDPYRIHHKEKIYSSGSKSKSNSKGYEDKGYEDGYILFSIAVGTNQHTGGKIYRRAFAYITDNDTATIHFMEIPYGDWEN